MSQGNRKETSSATCTGEGQGPSSRVEGQLTSQDEVRIALPPNDDRGHRYLRLNNGLECVLVSDATCDKAAAAMDVGVGASEDPENLQGCAHFCEHLLFLGTEKYPQENAYDAYLSANNGSANAYTNVSNTNYYFEVAPEAFKGALDRFAGFFTAPLFDASCTEREANAVDAEQNKNLQSDSWRSYQLRRHLSSSKHPYHMFLVGSRETLWDAPRREGRDPRAELIDWWKKMYCAKRMKLVLVARESLDTLEGWVREQFEGVPVRTAEGKEKILYDTEVMEEQQLCKLVFAEPVKDIRTLKMVFPFADQGPLYASKPGDYLSHLLGHEGPGSILSYLKRHGWADSLDAGCQGNTVGFDFFLITAELTPEGLKHYEDVVKILTSYIQLLRSTPPQRWIFEEIKAISEIRFQFVERCQPSNYVSDLASRLQKPIPREKIISSQSERFDPDAIESALRMLDIKRSVVIITAKTMPPGTESLDEVEPVFGTKFRREKMSERLLDAALKDALTLALQLPGPNAFIPQDLGVDRIEGKEPSRKPLLLRDTPLSRLWHKQDDRFWVPRANVYIALKSPVLDVTPRQAIVSRLYCDLFNDAITEEIYDAELAGLKYSLEHGTRSITVKLVGYNDKLHPLMAMMMTKMKEFQVDPRRFEVIKENLERECANFNLHEPCRLLRYYSRYAIAERWWTPSEELAELIHLTPDDVATFAGEFFARMHIETLVHGNMDIKDAKAMQNMVETVISARPLSATEKLAERTLLLPPSSEYVWAMPVPNAENINSACQYYCHVGNVEDDYTRPRLSLLARLAEEPIYNVLRTKEQLGYMVFSSTRFSAASMGFQILIQSEKPAAYLETRVEAFMEYFKSFLEATTEEEFQTTKQGLVATNLESPKNMHGESARFWKAIDDGYCDFERRFRDAEQIKQINKQEIIDLFMKYIHPSSTTRSKLSLHMDSQAPSRRKSDEVTQGPLEDGPSEDRHISVRDKDETKDDQSTKQWRVKESNIFVKNIVEWKAGLICGPAAKPLGTLVVASKE